MNNPLIKKIISDHKKYWNNKYFFLSSVFSLLLFTSGLFANFSAVKYTARIAGNSTSDFFLNILPVVNTDLIFSEGAIFFVCFVFILLILKPRQIPFTLKSVALFIIIRSIFVGMTHLAPYPDRIASDFDAWRYLSSGADLFFSGHTGLPFLFALLNWDDKYLSRIFLASSILAGTAVLFGHLHYTIDVFSAFFITYGIYHIAIKGFPRDYKIFKFGI